MKIWKVPLTLKSPLGTPLAADTLFGHLCWGLVYHEGERSLQEFLQQMSSSQPPLVLSDPFPAGFLPRPTLPGAPTSDRDWFKDIICRMDWQTLKQRHLVDEDDTRQAPPNELDAHDIHKRLSRRSWIAYERFADVIDSLDNQQLMRVQIDKGCGNLDELKTTQSPHNAINRLSGASEQLYFTEDDFYDRTKYPKGYVFDCYIWSDLPPARLKQLLVWALEGGYGRDKSTGKGAIDVGDLQEVTLPAAAEPNAVMLLGPCLPAPHDPTEGYWQVHAKAPKLGGDWAVGVGPDGQTHNPHKFPLVMLKAGSVLRIDTPRPWYGRMASDVHVHFKEVLQYGLAPALPVSLAHNEEVVI